MSCWEMGCELPGLPMYCTVKYLAAMEAESQPLYKGICPRSHLSRFPGVFPYLLLSSSQRHGSVGSSSLHSLWCWAADFNYLLSSFSTSFFWESLREDN